MEELEEENGTDQKEDSEEELESDCVTIRVALDCPSKVIHFRKLAKKHYPALFASSDDEEELEDNDEAEEDLEQEEDGEGDIEVDPGPILEDRVASGNRITGVIERIERIYTADDFEGYDLEDSFIDDSEWKAFKEAPSTKHSGFFINKGKIELQPDREPNSTGSKKRKRGALDSDTQRSPSKTKHQQLPASVEEALLALQEAAKDAQYKEALSKKRFPGGLDPLLYEVARRAKAAHPLGHFSAALLERLSSFLPFGARTLKGHMKRLLQLKGNDPALTLKELDTATRAFQTKIDSSMRTLLSLASSQPTQEEQISFQWQEDTENLLWQVFTALDRWVEAENEVRKKDKGKEPLSARSERKKKVKELASFWPSAQWMTPDQLLKMYTLLKGKHDKKDKRKKKGASIEKSIKQDKSAPLIFLE